MARLVASIGKHAVVSCCCHCSIGGPYRQISSPRSLPFKSWPGISGKLVPPGCLPVRLPYQDRSHEDRREPRSRPCRLGCKVLISAGSLVDRGRSPLAGLAPVPLLFRLRTVGALAHQTDRMRRRTHCSTLSRARIVRLVLQRGLRSDRSRLRR